MPQAIISGGLKARRKLLAFLDGLREQQDIIIPKSRIRNASIQAYHRYSNSGRYNHSPSETPLNPIQRAGLLSGEYPVDVSEEAIHIRTTPAQFHRLQHNFSLKLGLNDMR